MRSRTDRRRGDKPGICVPAGEQSLDVIERHQDITVGDDDPIVRGGAPALDHVIELGIGAHALIADQQSCIDRGISGNEVLDEPDDGVGRVSDAKQYFILRIIELECGTQRLRGIIVDSAQRAHQAHRRVIVDNRRRPAAQPDHRDRNTE